MDGWLVLLHPGLVLHTVCFHFLRWSDLSWLLLLHLPLCPAFWSHWPLFDAAGQKTPARWLLINLHYVTSFLQLHDYVQWKVKPRSVHTNISLNINHNGDLKRFFVWLDDVNYHKENSLAPNLLHTVQKHLDVHVEHGYNVQFYDSGPCSPTSLNVKAVFIVTNSVLHADMGT